MAEKEKGLQAGHWERWKEKMTLMLVPGPHILTVRDAVPYDGK